MSKSFKNLWHDPVWSKVIAGSILALGAIISTYLLNWWPAIGATTFNFLAYLKTTWTLPVWLAVVVIALSIPTIVFLIASLWYKVFPSAENLGSWQSYTTDIFYNLRWRWSYFDDGQIYKLTTFCPICDYQLYADNLSSFRVIDHIAFSCDSCKRDICEFQESVAMVESKVMRYIQQKLINGSWQNV